MYQKKKIVYKYTTYTYIDDYRKCLQGMHTYGDIPQPLIKLAIKGSHFVIVPLKST